MGLGAAWVGGLVYVKLTCNTGQTGVGLRFSSGWARRVRWVNTDKTWGGVQLGLGVWFRF